MNMRYLSTRGTAPVLNFTDVLMAGLASDGGLYLPATYPQLSLDTIKKASVSSYQETAFAVMWPYVQGCIPESDFYELIQKAYARFHHPAVTPLLQLGANSWLLELYHGPTLAFKDVALCLLGQLFDYTLKQKSQKLTVIGATSGDTGSAAIEGLRGLDNVDVFIFYPHNRTSDVQRKQMTTVADKNIHAIAVEGTFDDCQAIVKTLFADQEFRSKVNLGAVNSINWARVMAQIVYYVTSASYLGAPHRGVSFSVPTGNFGDILAGYVAHKMGLPIHKLAIATNANNILARCYETGVYAKNTVQQTQSPSMDIQISSNFERLLFDLSGRDADLMVSIHAQLAQTGTMTLPKNVHQKLQGLFLAGDASDEETMLTMKRIYEETNLLVDPHTAVGLTVSQKLGMDKMGVPVVHLACASPAKFPQNVQEATSIYPALPAHLADLWSRTERLQTIPNDINIVKDILLQAQA